METVDWGYVLSTLAIRYIAIFIVLTLLIILLTINGAIVSKITARKERKEEPVTPPPKPRQAPSAGPKVLSPDELEPETLAAIGLAIDLHQNQNRPQSADDTSGDQWRIAGRHAQWRNRR